MNKTLRPIGYLTRDAADKLRARVTAIARIYAAPIADDVPLHTAEDLAAAVAAEREACAEVAYAYLDDAELSGSGHAAGCAAAIREREDV